MSKKKLAVYKYFPLPCCHCICGQEYTKMKLTLASKRRKTALCSYDIFAQYQGHLIKRNETEKDGHFFAFLQE